MWITDFKKGKNKQKYDVFRENNKALKNNQLIIIFYI